MENDMKTMIMMAGLAFLLGTTTLAVAGKQGCCGTTTVSETVGNDKTDTQLACNPVIANYNKGWKHITCPMRGSGPGLSTITREVPTCSDKSPHLQ
jgi:hypothetical protein